MKNPYLRSILKASLIISILFTVAAVVGQWADRYSIPPDYSSIYRTGSTPRTSVEQQNIDERQKLYERQNIYGKISKTAIYVATGALMPLYPVSFLTDSILGAVLLGLIGPIIVFLPWFIILYIATYLYAKFVKKNLTSEVRNQKSLIVICVLTTILLSAGLLVFSA